MIRLALALLLNRAHVKDLDRALDEVPQREDHAVEEGEEILRQRDQAVEEDEVRPDPALVGVQVNLETAFPRAQNAVC